MATRAETMVKSPIRKDGDAVDVALAAQRSIRAYSRLRDVHPDMTLLQALFLLVVAANPGISQRRAYAVLDTNDSNAARTIAILSDIGGRTVAGLDLVSSTINPMDRRERILNLTPKGRRVMADIVADLYP